MELSRLSVHPIERVYVNIALFALCMKLLISPWATGVYETASVNSIAQLFDILILCSVLIYIPFTLRTFSFLYVVALISGLTFCLSTMIYTDESLVRAITAHLRVYLPLMLFPMLASYFSKDFSLASLIAKRLCLYIAVLTIAGLVLLPDSGNRLELWLPSYFGGLHTTAYVALSVFFILYVLHISHQVSLRLLTLCGLAILVTISVGWGVRTATGAGLIFLGLLLSNRMRLGESSLFESLLPLLGVVLLFIAAFVVATPEFELFTSGRTSMYMEKVEQLGNNEPLAWLIGNGAGSDLIITEIWWWEEKGAHSDVLTFLVEGGVIYLGLALATFAYLYRMFAQSGVRFIILAFMFTITFSNGLITRPLPAYVFYVSLALAFAYFYQEEQHDQ